MTTKVNCDALNCLFNDNFICLKTEINHIKQGCMDYEKRSCGGY